MLAFIQAFAGERPALFLLLLAIALLALHVSLRVRWHAAHHRMARELTDDERPVVHCTRSLSPDPIRTLRIRGGA